MCAHSGFPDRFGRAALHVQVSSATWTTEKYSFFPEMDFFKVYKGAYLSSIRNDLIPGMANQLYLHPLFQTKVELLSPDARVSLSYKRAKLVMQTHR
jgi:hypothetical protein